MEREDGGVCGGRQAAKGDVLPLRWAQSLHVLLPYSHSFCCSLNYVPPEKRCPSPSHCTGNVTLKIGLFADVIKLRQGHTGAVWALTQ